MRFGKIDVTKILKDHLFKGEKGTYLDYTEHENKEGRDKFGNDGFVTQSLSKEARDRGEKGPIIGNWKRPKEKINPVTKTAPKAQSAPLKMDSEGSDEVPF